MNQQYLFRFDDVSLNTDRFKLRSMIDFIQSRLSDVRIMLCISPAVHCLEQKQEALERERAFPSELKVESDFRQFYLVNKFGLPEIVYDCRVGKINLALASHGLIHVDHRLLKRSAQELSIVMSCSLVGTRIFVPPFHKWNEKTEAICQEHGINLHKFTPSAWRHLKYHKFDPFQPQYYLHTHDFSYDGFVERFS
jgi:hypothetical protein